MLFSVFRSKGGFSNNPTCYQTNFISKKSIVYADVKSLEYANWIALDDTEILKVFDDILKRIERKKIIVWEIPNSISYRKVTKPSTY